MVIGQGSHKSLLASDPSKRMQTILIEPDDPRWAEVLPLVPHEFYHLPGYTRLEAARMRGTPKALYAEDAGRRFLLPFVLREIPAVVLGAETASPKLDGASPWGYPGPLVSSAESDADAFLKAALVSGRETLRAHGVISLFVRLSPLFPISAVLGQVGTLMEHGPCYWLNLDESEEELQRQLRGRYRSYLNALRRDGVEARFIPFVERMDEFIALNHHTMERVGAADWYYFNRGFYEGLNALLGDSLKLCAVELDGRMLAGGLFITSGGIVQYYVSGVDKALGQPHATKLMIATVRDWAKASGHHRFNLGGGVGANDDALSQFKRGFTKHSSTFHSWRLIADEDWYGRAVSHWETRNGLSADSLSGYFPAYRKPVVKEQSA